MGVDDYICMILLGKTGSGKSALGNNLLRRNVFESRLSAGRVTHTVTKEVSHNSFGHKLVVVDTPDFTMRETPEIEKMSPMPIPRPHAFLFVTSVDEDPNSLTESFRILRTQFSDQVLRYTLVVFTREHDLRRDQELNSSEEYIQNLPGTLRKLIGDCRHIFLDNAAPNDEKEAKLQTLINEVNEMRKENQPENFDFRPYTYGLRKRDNNVKSTV